MLNVIKTTVLAGYWLNFKVKIGQREDSIQYAVRNMTHRSKACQSLAEVCTHWRKFGCGGGEELVLGLAMKSGHKPTVLQQILTEMWSVPVLCSAHHTSRHWPEMSEEMPRARAQCSQRPWIHHARFVAAEQPLPESSWLQNLAAQIQQRVHRTKVQDVNDWRRRLDWWCGLERNAALVTTPSTRGTKHLHACIRTRPWHFLYLLWHTLVKTLFTVTK